MSMGHKMEHSISLGCAGQERVKRQAGQKCSIICPNQIWNKKLQPRSLQRPLRLGNGSIFFSCFYVPIWHFLNLLKYLAWLNITMDFCIKSIIKHSFNQFKNLKKNLNETRMKTKPYTTGFNEKYVVAWS